MGRKRATGKTGMAGVNTTYEPKNTGSVTASAGPTGPAGQKAATGNMGTPGGGKSKMSQGGDAGGITAGHARARKGKNSTGSGPQGMRG